MSSHVSAPGLVEHSDPPVDVQGYLPMGSGRGRILVEYTGPTALVLTGPITGARYFFDQPGARVEVDVRDRQVILSVPVLRGVVGA